MYACERPLNAKDTAQGTTHNLQGVVLTRVPICQVLKTKGWKLTHILNTHHHHDHAGGNLELKKATSCTIIGPKGEADKIPGIDTAVDQGDTIKVGNQVARVLNVGGHTKGHVAFHFEDAGIAFVGDSLFAMGCGRMFEGTYEQMYASLQNLASLPDETAIYCAHEYTQANGKFAMSVEPGNEALQKRVKEVMSLALHGQFLGSMKCIIVYLLAWVYIYICVCACVRVCVCLSERERF